MDTIGRYQLVEKVGQGGMGVVYRAFDTLLQRVVALKVISGNIDTTPEQRERFFREARAAGQLSHRNIIIIHDLGEVDGQPYLAMEYLDGEDLQRRLAGPDRMSVARKVDLMIQVCEGLEYAHSHGVVHRDIKPANIFLTDSGTAKILDFGLARLVTSELTNSNMMMGTVNYMAPEQVRGERADSRSDIFSIGVVLYELLGGRKAFDADSFAATLFKILQEDPEPLATLDSRLPRELIAIVDRALAKRRDERYQQISEVLRDLAVCRPLLDAPEFRSGERPSSGGHARHSDPPRERPASRPSHAPPAVTVASDAPRHAPDPIAVVPEHRSAMRLVSSHSRAIWFGGGAAVLTIVMIGIWATRSRTPSAPAVPIVAVAPSRPAPPSPAPGASSTGHVAVPETTPAVRTTGDTPDDAQRLADTARARMAGAKAEARAAGAPARAPAAYDTVLGAEREAQRLYDRHQLLAAAPKFYEASGLFTSAEIAARSATAAPAPAPASSPKPPVQITPPSPAPVETAPPPAPPPPVTDARPSPPAVRTGEPAPIVTAPVVTPALTPPVPREVPADTAIAELLSRYKDALEARSLDALKRLWPGIPDTRESAFRNEFQYATRLSVEIGSPHIVVSGSTATATFVGRVEIVTTDGQRHSNESPTTMTFRRTPSGWVIDTVRVETVR